MSKKLQLTPGILLTLFITSISTKYANFEQKRLQTNKILTDLPQRSDLLRYLVVLDKIFDYINDERDLIDINLALGVFLANVNLKHAMINRQWHVPKPLLKKTGDIISKAEKWLKNFYAVMEFDDDVNLKPYQQIYSMFKNDTVWIKRLSNFEFHTSKVLQMLRQPKEKYTTWDTYVKKDSLPPDVSDMCLASLAENPITFTDHIPTCKLKTYCYDILRKGSDYGYSLTHRLLIMLMARFGRGCVIFSPVIDKELSRRFCAMTYAEAEFIAKEGYKHIDLMMEQMAVCSFMDSTILRRAWLNRLVSYQTTEGWFRRVYTKRDAMNNDEYEDYGVYGYDNTLHTTATAAGCFSAAVRFVFEASKA